MICSNSCFVRTCLLRCATMLLLAPGLLGCGGGALSQEDMKKMGIRRKKDEDPPKVAQAASPPKSPQASKQAETPQTETVAKTTKSPEQLPQSKIPPHKKASPISDEPLSDTRSPPARWPAASPTKCEMRWPAPSWSSQRPWAWMAQNPTSA